MNEDVDWFKLCEGCGECCGFVPFARHFIKKHREQIQVKYKKIPFGRLILPETEDFHCIFLDRKNKRCLIYDERPQACRLQGTIPELPCPKLNPELCDKMDFAIDRLQSIVRLLG